ncbi:hypothetical protein A3B19_01775 [Candidatus Giovannonibacteria bacterium RIFCSPLOWO2_01_FULL_46_32]|uniref:DUF5667 domain-containing protein n=1 Tax=Candidatus Giovannonibacteria bacterium RIFCSPLOWO2_01_FULL_46_32 TaxID=1798353 RepID=A0A1F5XGZ1_9BACT|nr:MAG: hypothetical protein A3B19_01775 [Candidatus Giovannonibacteria bacterium RIFCSPLOWO2_01_FULL_46_32]
MNKKYFFALALALFGAVSIGVIVFAADIQYPVSELGNCANEQACKNYCDKPSNNDACLNFAEKNGLMSSEEIATARKLLGAGPGPGGCKTKDTCEKYCDSVSHIDECVAFAEKNDLMPPQQLEEAKKIQAAKASGVKMPSCDSKKQCDSYCSESANMEECITFAQEAGFMEPQELEESKKVLAAIKAGAKPPPCRGKEECDAYCSQEEHFDACFDFALAAGFIDPKDAEMARKTRGKGPGGCRGKDECDSFCQQEGNMETCAQFAYDNGMMTKEEFEMMKKTGGKGPGGCKSKEECESFCNDVNNQETCFNFAKENGMMQEADLQQMEQSKQQFKTAMQNMPPEVYSCLESVVGAETMAKFKSGEAMPPREIGDKMRECFEKNMPQGQEGRGAPGSMPPEGGGPGNMPPGGGVSGPGMTGPGGCTSPEECKRYCESNPDACRNFQPPAQPMQGGAPVSGFNPMPCEGENCPPPPEGYQQYQYQLPLQPMQPGTQISPEGFSQPPEGYSFPPPPTQEGTQGIYNPPAEMSQPIEQQQFIPPPPPPEEQPVSFGGSALGLILYPLSLLFR